MNGGQGSSDSFLNRFEGRIAKRNNDGTTAPISVASSTGAASKGSSRPRKGMSNGATRPRGDPGAVVAGGGGGKSPRAAQAAPTSSRPRKGMSNGVARPPPSNGSTNRGGGGGDDDGSVSPARRIQQKTNSIFENLHAGMGPDPLGGLPDGADGG